MKLSKLAAIAVAAPMLMGTFTVAMAEDMADKAIGVWLREKKGWHVEFAPCGENLCGEVISGEGVDKKTGETVVGVKMLFDLKKKNENTWIGKMYNPGDGNNYKGKVKVLDDNMVKMSGCMAGFICRSEKWPRVEVAAVEETAEDMADDMMDDAAHAADDAMEHAAEAVEGAANMAEGAMDEAAEAVEGAMEDAQ